MRVEYADYLFPEKKPEPMSSRLPIAAFFSWMLLVIIIFIAFVIASKFVDAWAGYLLLLLGIGVLFVLGIAVLVIGFATRTMIASILGLCMGLVLVTFVGGNML